MNLAQAIASKLQAIANCGKSGNTEWISRHTDAVNALASEYLPSGSGFDSGTDLDWLHSKPERLVFDVAFHHMDEHGGYWCWTHHQVIVTASLVHGLNIRVTGKDRNGIKDYIAEAFEIALTGECAN